MSLHSIIEPAGTLATGWKLVPHRTEPALRNDADIRNDDDAPPPVDDEGDRTPDAGPRSGQSAPRSRWEMSEGG